LKLDTIYILYIFVRQRWKVLRMILSHSLQQKLNMNMNACTYGIGFNNNMYNGYYDPTTLFNGSIFGNYCNPDWDGMCGYELTKFFASAATGAIGTAISNSKENSVENHEAAVEDLQEQLDTELEKLPGCNIDNYKNYSVKNESWYKKESEDINNKKTTYQKDILTDEYLTTFKKNIKDYEDAKNRLATMDDTDPEYTKLSEEVKTGETQYKVWKEKVEKHDTAKTELEKLKTAETKLEEKAVEEQNKANEIIENINNLQKEIDKKQKELEARIFDKADGASSLFRNKDLKTENLTQGTVNFDSADIRELCSRFPKLPEGSYEKYDCARAFAQLDNTVFQRLATPTQIRAREIATEYYEKHKANPPKKVESTEATT